MKSRHPLGLLLVEIRGEPAQSISLITRSLAVRPDVPDRSRLDLARAERAAGDAGQPPPRPAAPRPSIRTSWTRMSSSVAGAGDTGSCGGGRGLGTPRRFRRDRSEAHVNLAAALARRGTPGRRRGVGTSAPR